MLIHGFEKRRLKFLRKKMPIGSTIPEPDCRGKHDNSYSRHDNPGRLYLSPELSVARMFLAKYVPDYVSYLERRREVLVNHKEATDSVERKPIITEHYYHDVFVNEFNIHFGYPRSDTCDTCDSLEVKTEAAESEEEKGKLEKQLQDHLKLADQLVCARIVKGVENPGHSLVVVLCLHQCHALRCEHQCEAQVNLHLPPPPSLWTLCKIMSLYISQFCCAQCVCEKKDEVPTY